MKPISEGDRIVATISGEVTRIFRVGNKIAAVLDDGVTIQINAPGLNVRKARPRKPAQNEVITGKRLKETMWKRGTIVRGIHASCGPHSGYVLLENGRWQSLDNPRMQYAFAAFPDRGEYEVRFVA